jgi:hypothetical protein
MNIITNLSSLNFLNRALRQIAFCGLLCALGWAHTVKAQTTQTLDNVYLYSSPVTAAFFTNNFAPCTAMRIAKFHVQTC